MQLPPLPLPSSVPCLPFPQQRVVQDKHEASLGQKGTPQEGKQSVAANESENENANGETENGIKRNQVVPKYAPDYVQYTRVCTYICIYKYICTIYVYHSSLHFKLPRCCCCCCMPHGPTASLQRRVAAQRKQKVQVS